MTITSIAWAQPVATHDMDFEMTVEYADGTRQIVTDPREQVKLQAAFMRQVNPDYEPGPAVVLTAGGSLGWAQQ